MGLRRWYDNRIKSKLVYENIPRETVQRHFDIMKNHGSSISMIILSASPEKIKDTLIDSTNGIGQYIDQDGLFSVLAPKASPTN